MKNEDVSMAETPERAVDPEEQKSLDEQRAKRTAEREANLAQIAPSAKPQPKKENLFQKKTRQVFGNNRTPEQTAQSKLRYEEALPWHLEDFDNKNIWVGGYEAALSETYGVLFHESGVAGGQFRMLPIEKWYKFSQKKDLSKRNFATGADEATKMMKKKVEQPKWFKEVEEKDKQELAERKATKGLFLGKWGAEEKGRPSTQGRRHEQVDADDLDFEEDRFADDEENPIFDGMGEDEAKEAEDRIKRDALKANIFDLKNERDYDKEEMLEQKEKEEERKLGKSLKKALQKREKNYAYDSDRSDENPFESEVHNYRPAFSLTKHY